MTMNEINRNLLKSGNDTKLQIEIFLIFLGLKMLLQTLQLLSTEFVGKQM